MNSLGAPEGRRQYPQLDWLIETKARIFAKGNWLPIIVKYDASPERSLEWFTELSWLATDLHRGVRVPAIFKVENLPSALKGKPFPFCTLLVDSEFLKRILRDKGWNRTILQAEVGPVLNDAAARQITSTDAKST